MLLTQDFFIPQIKECNLNDAVNRMNDRHVVYNLAPIPDKPKRKLSKRERRQERIYQAGLKKKAARRPVFSAAEQAIWEPSASELKYKRLFQKAQRAFNAGGPPVSLADSVDDPAKKEILERSERLTAFYHEHGYAPGGMGDPHRAANAPATVTPSSAVADAGGVPEPTPECPPAATLVSKLNKAMAKREAANIRSLVQRFRRLRDATHADAGRAFDDSLATARELTRDRMDNGAGVNGDVIADTAKSAFLKIEAQACRSAQRLVEDAVGRPVSGYTANAHTAALTAFTTGIKRVHVDANGPAHFGDAVQVLGSCFEKSYYASVIRSCKKVRVIGGGCDGQVLDLRIASMLKSYELLLPAVESKN